MTFNFSLFSKCAGCKKRKLFICRKWIKPKTLPRVKPKEKMCNKCLSIYEKY